MIKPSELNREQREAFDVWRSLGLTESAAMDALVENGVVTLSEEDRLARNFQQIFGLSERAAADAARGRGGGSASTPAAESRASARSDDAARLIRIIEAWSQDLLAR